MQQAACSALLAAGSSAETCSALSLPALHKDVCLGCDNRSQFTSRLTRASSFSAVGNSTSGVLCPLGACNYGTGLWRQVRITLQMSIWRSHMKVEALWKSGPCVLAFPSCSAVKTTFESFFSCCIEGWGQLLSALHKGFFSTIQRNNCSNFAFLSSHSLVLCCSPCLPGLVFF